MQLLHAHTTNGAGALCRNYAYLQTIYIWGEFGGATVTLQGSPDGEEWFDLTEFSTKSVISIGLNARYLRAVVAGATSSSNITMRVE